MGDAKEYKDLSEDEVVAHARSLLGKSLRGIYGESVGTRKGKGAFGQLLEQVHFGYEPNSAADRDFPNAELELKATGAEFKRGEWRAKERLVLSNINYHSLVGETNYEASSFYLKNARLLLVVYYWVAELEPADYLVVGVGVINIAEMDPADRAIIEDDWRKIRRAVIDGRAHELSEADTNYLKATRKGAGRGKDDRSQPNNATAAPNRAFSFKQSFLTELIQKFVIARSGVQPQLGSETIVRDATQLEEKTFDELVLGRFERFRGLEVTNIVAQVDPSLNRRAKGFYADVARRMLGVTTRRVEEFEKADIVMKVVRVREDGRPAEAVSFPAFRFKDLVTQNWLDSELRELFTKRFLFVFYQETGATVLFHHAAFWVMPETVLDGVVQDVWQETVDAVASGRPDRFPREGDGRTVHVRPHARNAADTDEMPDGQLTVKRSFWLNRDLIAKVFRGG